MKKSRASDGRSAKRNCVGWVLAVALFGCTGSIAADTHGRWPSPTYYTVVARPGDTLNIIAERYRAAPSRVARLNHLSSTGAVTAGSIVFVPAITRATRDAVLSEAMDRGASNHATRPAALVVAHSAVSAAKLVKPVPSPRARPAGGVEAADLGASKPLRFAWPIGGLVISSFGPGAHGTRNDGINIAAEGGAPFRAAADGKVSYAGPFRGYGNLILITHSHSYTTAYAHAGNITVARGQTVAKGQVIGTAGTTGGVDRPQLHFEIRRGLKPVDPNLLLAANS